MKLQKKNTLKWMLKLTILMLISLCKNMLVLNNFWVFKEPFLKLLKALTENVSGSETFP